jgi:hypothetical protein
MVLDSLGDLKAEPAAGVESERLGTAFHICKKSLFILGATAEKMEITQHIGAIVGVTGGFREMVLRDPDEPIGKAGTAAETSRAFNDQRSQAMLMRGKGGGEAGNARTDNYDVPFLKRQDDLPTALLRTPGAALPGELVVSANHLSL